jgi:hypothetical protein
VIDLKHEIERELSLMDPPDLWDRIRAEAANDGDAAVVELTTAQHRRRPSLWLAVAAVTVLLAVVGLLALLDDDPTVDTTPATEVPVVPEPPTSVESLPVQDVSISSCRAVSGVATAGFSITNRSSPASNEGASDYTVRIRIEDGSGGKIGDAVATIKVFPGNTRNGEAVALIPDDSPGGPEVMNCFAEDVERVVPSAP